MTIVEVTLDKTKKYKKVLVSGHSGYDVIGKDIVCASISVAMYMSANLISQVTTDFSFIEDEKNTKMELEVNDDSKFVNIIIENLIYTLENISKSYAKFLKIKIYE